MEDNWSEKYFVMRFAFEWQLLTVRVNINFIQNFFCFCRRSWMWILLGNSHWKQFEQFLFKLLQGKETIFISGILPARTGLMSAPSVAIILNWCPSTENWTGQRLTPEAGNVLWSKINVKLLNMMHNKIICCQRKILKAWTWNCAIQQ